jgi:hypothetical protein
MRLPGTSPLHITHLNLSRNGITCRGMVSVSHAMCRMAWLQHVDISSNRIGCTGWNAVGEVLASCKNLSELVISGNSVHHTDAVYASAEAGNVQSPPSSSVQGERFARNAHHCPNTEIQCNNFATLKPTPESALDDISGFAAGVACSAKLARLHCSSCSLSAQHMISICAAACITANVRTLGRVHPPCRSHNMS